MASWPESCDRCWLQSCREAPQRFADEPDAPWFPAKPIVIHLQYMRVMYALVHVHTDDTFPLKKLVEIKGATLGGGALAPSPLQSV